MSQRLSGKGLMEKADRVRIKLTHFKAKLWKNYASLK